MKVAWPWAFWPFRVGVPFLCAFGILAGEANAQEIETPAQNSWLSLDGSIRIRGAVLSRETSNGNRSDQAALSARTTIGARAYFQEYSAGLEILDARIYSGKDVPVNTTHSNALDILQAGFAFDTQDFFRRGDQLNLRIGRMTIDLGSRRLVARNQFRNTINAFTGVDAKWSNSEGHQARFIAVVPVRRRPTDPEKIKENGLAFNQEDTQRLLTGVLYAAPLEWLLPNSRGEAFLVTLVEVDGSRATRNRRLFTPGARIEKKPDFSAFDGELEAMLQVGSTRADRDTEDDQDHLAYFFHGEVGYTMPFARQTRLALQYDHVSGDGNPNDNKSGRFDTLYGARRFEFGPTGIYGAFARANIMSPGFRLEAAPLKSIDFLAAHRLFWLESSRDAWTTTGITDAQGGSGTFIGQQSEARLRWHLPHVDIEAGAAFFLRGTFVEKATEMTAASTAYPSLFLYTQVTAYL